MLVGFRVQGSRFRVHGLGVQGFGVQDLGSRQCCPARTWVDKMLVDFGVLGRDSIALQAAGRRVQSWRAAAVDVRWHHAHCRGENLALSRQIT